MRAMTVHVPDWLDRIPRVALGHLPTPLEALDALSEELGGPRIWLKRDDCTGLATGGNKTRKLEYLLAAARAEGATDVVTFGAVQSNHARQTAAACAKLAMPCHLFLSRQVAWPHAAYEVAGNPLIDRLAGAEVHIVAADEIGDVARDALARMQTAGRSPYVIPAGGSNAIGALGYVRCAYEIAAQCAALGITPSTIVHASSSAGTQAGLAYGLARLGGKASALGINVYHTRPEKLEQAVRALVADLAAANGVAADVRYRFDHRYLGEAYGMPTAACIDAIRMAASLEGVLFDPVYSGKALGALIDLISVGEFAGQKDIILLHTGGTAALAVYAEAFS